MASLPARGSSNRGLRGLGAGSAWRLCFFARSANMLGYPEAGSRLQFACTPSGERALSTRPVAPRPPRSLTPERRTSRILRCLRGRRRFAAVFAEHSRKILLLQGTDSVSELRCFFKLELFSRLAHLRLELRQQLGKLLFGLDRRRGCIEFGGIERHGDVMLFSVL